MVVNSILSRMMELGFSEYESRAYIALLEESPATAYETAKRAGIPSSKIYQVADRLLDKGLINMLEQEGRKLYVPLPPEEFIASRRANVARTIEGLEEDFAAFAGNPEVSYIWNMSRYEEFMQRAERLVQTARSSLLVSLWQEELAVLEPALLDLQEQGVPVAAVLFGRTTSCGLSVVYRHPIERTLYAERGGRGFAMVADSGEAMVGTLYPDGRVEGAWSRTRGFVTLAEDYIKHDIYIMKIVDRYDDELIRRFGENYALLREVFADRERHRREDGTKRRGHENLD